MKYQELEMEVVYFYDDVIRTSVELGENETERVPFVFGA